MAWYEQKIKYNQKYNKEKYARFPSPFKVRVLKFDSKNYYE